MDLLLYFINRDRIDIYDIPISKIANDYLEHVKMMEMMDMLVLLGTMEMIMMMSLSVMMMSMMSLAVRMVLMSLLSLVSLMSTVWWVWSGCVNVCLQDSHVWRGVVVWPVRHSPELKQLSMYMMKRFSKSDCSRLQRPHQLQRLLC